MWSKLYTLNSASGYRIGQSIAPALTGYRRNRNVWAGVSFFTQPDIGLSEGDVQGYSAIKP